MQSKMRSASGSRKSRSRRNACSRRSRQRGDPQREPADVQPARNAGGQRAFLGGAAELFVEAGLRDLPERLTFDRLPAEPSTLMGSGNTKPPRSAAGGIERNRKFVDSLLEGNGFELPVRGCDESGFRSFC